jgi:hypothetical protein
MIEKGVEGKKDNPPKMDREIPKLGFYYVKT